MEMHRIRTERFCPHENVYTLNYKLKMYAFDFMLYTYARMRILSAFNYDRKM